MDSVINTITGEQLNFFDLFRRKNYFVEIPIIQRDYAQGRESKEKIRNTFLDSLYNHLNNEECIDLDFIYGSVSETFNNFGKFIPLDGQQRLTTLFLLHWYLANKDKKIEKFKEYLLVDGISRFTYKTRTSSREFCNSFVNNDLDFEMLIIEDDGNIKNRLSEIIRDSSWYFLSWDRDPTIKGMLTMLDAIDSKFKESNGFFEKLTHSTNPIITFQFLNLKDLKMTDDLYIKMNARGKSLSDYENFKAQFEKFIEINHSEYEKEFSDKIDGIWCDLFWDFSVNHPQKISYNIDTQILRFFDFITEMLYCLLQRTDEEAYDFNDFKIIEKTYTSEKNLLFLMRSLDLFSNFSQKNQKNNLDIFFKDIFSKEFEENKVCLFDNSTNLLEKLMYDEKSFDHKDKLLLFSLIYYQIASDSMKLTVTDNLKYFIRICRNFIFKINQKGNSTKKDEFLSDLRTYHYSDIIKTFILIFDKDNVYNSLRRKKEEFKFRIDNINEEIHKAEIINRDENNIKYIHKLEDHKYLRGDLHNFELLLSNKENIESLTEHFYTIWEDYTDSFIIKSLLSVGDYAIWIGGCYFGGLYFFGIKDKWHRIFADKDNSKKLKTIFKNYFENLQSLGNISVDDKLEKLISDGLLNPKGPDWIKLFLKYDTITETNHGIYSFRHDFEYNIDRIEGTSLKGFHINSFIHAVFESNNLTPKFSNRWWTTGAEENIITLKKSMSMQPLDDYWYINSMYNDISILIEEFNLEQIEGKKNKFKLFPTEKKDFVEIAIEFINRIYE